MTISVIHKRINTLEELQSFLSSFPDRVGCTVPHHLLRAGKFKDAVIETQLYTWHIIYTGPVSEWYSFVVGTGEGCEFTGTLHIIRPHIHSVLFYHQGAPEVSVHIDNNGEVEVSAWSPRTNTFKSATIQKGHENGISEHRLDHP